MRIVLAVATLLCCGACGHYPFMGGQVAALGSLPRALQLAGVPKVQAKKIARHLRHLQAASALPEMRDHLDGLHDTISAVRERLETQLHAGIDLSAALLLNSEFQLWGNELKDELSYLHAFLATGDGDVLQRLGKIDRLLSAHLKGMEDLL